MHRILIFSPARNELQNWLTWLEPSFQVTLITHIDSFINLATTWNPQVIIYACSKMNSDFSHTYNLIQIHNRFGLVIVNFQYSIREEIKAFELGADHFLLSTSPNESIKVRLQALANKIEEIRNKIIPISLTVLPQKSEPQTYRGIQLFENQNSIKYDGVFTVLTPTQCLILSALLNHKGELVSREWIKKYVFKDKKMSLRSIDAHIAKLKVRLPQLKDAIINVYGKGYVLRNDKAAA